MAVLSSGGSGAVRLSGVQRTVDVHMGVQYRLNTDFFTGFQAFWSDGFCVRSGSYLTGHFPTGAAALDGVANNPLKGAIELYATSGGVNKDMYSLIAPRVRIVRPASVIFDPFAVWEVETHIGINPLAAALTQDCGLIMHGNTSVTGYANGFLNGGGVGNPGQLGFAVSFFGGPAAPKLRFFARKLAAGAVTEGTDLPFITGSQAYPRVIRVKVRLESATPTADAKLTVFADDVLQLTRVFTDASTLPGPAQIDVPQQWLGGFRPFVRMCTNAGANTALGCGFWRVSAAPSVAAMG